MAKILRHWPNICTLCGNGNTVLCYEETLEGEKIPYEIKCMNCGNLMEVDHVEYVEDDSGILNDKEGEEWPLL